MYIQLKIGDENMLKDSRGDHDDAENAYNIFGQPQSWQHKANNSSFWWLFEAYKYVIRERERAQAVNLPCRYLLAGFLDSDIGCYDTDDANNDDVRTYVHVTSIYACCDSSNY